MYKIYSNRFSVGQSIFYIIFLIVAAFFLYFNYSPPPLSFLLESNLKSNLKNTPTFFLKSSLVTPKKIQFVHSPSLTKIDKNHLLAVYFAGSREGAPDVKLYSSVFDIKNKKWSDSKIFFTRQQLFKDSHFYIKKLGNAVIYKQNKMVHFFVVAPSFGGWSMSRIYHYLSDDQGKNFKFHENLILSPVFNISTLIRTQPVGLANNGFLLPVYHENESNYPFLMVFDAKGDFQKIIRPNHLKNQIQPSVAAYSNKNCLIGFRNHDNFLDKQDHVFKIQFCQKNGKKWPLPINTNIKNEDESINLIYFNKNIFLIHTQKDRTELVLSQFDFEKNEFNLFKIIDKTQDSYFKYPNAIVDANFLHIMYTNNKIIKHIMLNNTFLKSV